MRSALARACLRPAPPRYTRPVTELFVSSRPRPRPSRAEFANMHEFGLMQNALEIALEHAQRQGAQCIHLITLRVGALSGIVPEALAFAFEALAPGTLAATARLEMEPVPVVCYCPVCDRGF